MYKMVTLDEVCLKVEKVNANLKQSNGYFNYFDIGGIDNKTNKIESFKTCNWNAAPSRAQQIIKKGDVLFSTVRTYLKNIALVDKDEFTGQIASSGFTVLRPKPDLLDPKYLFLYTLTDAFLQPLAKLQTGSSYPAVRDKDVFSQQIPLPPLPVQQAIVATLEALFSELNKGIEQLKIAQQQLHTYRQAVLKAAFTGHLTGEQLQQGNFPEGWKQVKLNSIATVNPKLPGKENISPRIDIQFVPMKHVEEEINKINCIETRKLSEVQKGSYTAFIDGDIIFAKVTPCMENGKIAVAKNLLNGIGYGSSEFHVVRPTSNAVSEFIFFFLVQHAYRKEAEAAMTGAVGLRRVPRQFLENTIVPLPDVDKQKIIVSSIESRLSVADKMEKTIAVNLKHAETLRQSILKEAYQ